MAPSLHARHDKPSRSSAHSTSCRAPPGARSSRAEASTLSSTTGRSFSSMVSSMASATQTTHSIAASVLAQTPVTCTACSLRGILSDSYPLSAIVTCRMRDSESSRVDGSDCGHRGISSPLLGCTEGEGAQLRRKVIVSEAVELHLKST